MIRHGYVSCTACHVSPDGGGVLTNYGRSLSGELLSSASLPWETKPFWEAFRAPDYLAIGGDIRALQVIRDTPNFREGRFVWMQSDLEVAVNHGSVTAVVTAGADAVSGEIRPLFRRHYVMYSLNDTTAIRVGKFALAYGIHLPDHRIQIRNRTLWDQGMETYNVEASHLGETEVFVSAKLLDKTSVPGERGFLVRAAQNFKDTYKLGASFFYGNTGRVVVGPYATLGFSNKIYLLVEADWITPNEVLGFAKFGNEVAQGWHVFAFCDYGRKTTTGLGITVFPRPHGEFLLQLGQNFSDSETTVLSMFHLYL